jgi:hypothetical protein
LRTGVVAIPPGGGSAKAFSPGFSSGSLSREPEPFSDGPGHHIDRIWQGIGSRLSPARESYRTNEALESAILQIASRLEGGAAPRDDGFFDEDSNKRSSAEERLEGVLLKARDQYEEKKLPYLGNFYANVNCSAAVLWTLANYFLKVANDLSYRQFALLAFIQKEGTWDARAVRNGDHSLPDLSALAREEMELHDGLQFWGVWTANWRWTVYG